MCLGMYGFGVIQWHIGGSDELLRNFHVLANIPNEMLIMASLLSQSAFHSMGLRYECNCVEN